MSAKTLLLFGLLLATCAVVVPFFTRARTTTAMNACVNNLRQLDGVKQQWALEYKKTTNDLPTWDDIWAYLGSGPRGRKREAPVCPQGGTYKLGRVNELPKCSVGGPSHALPQ